MKVAGSREEFVQEMERRGYQVRWEKNRKCITYTTPAGMKCRDDRLHELKFRKENMEHEFGIKCVAMPIFDRNKNVYAAISISGLAHHFTSEHIAEWAILLKKYISKIENRL